MEFRIALAVIFTAVALTACDKAEEVSQKAVEKTTETVTEVAASATDKATKIAEEAK
ncbi:MAG: histone H3/H4, partial [Cocleimonas sp.]